MKVFGFSLSLNAMHAFIGNARNHYLILRDPIKSLQLSSIGDDEYTPHPDIIVADLTSSFTVLLAIFFPSVTGMPCVV